MKKFTTAQKVILGVLLLAIVVIALTGLLRNGPAEKSRADPAPTPTPKVVYQEVETIVEHETFVEVEKTITSSVIEEGLRNLGVLITQEYFFTEVCDYKDVKKFFNTNITVPFSESSYICSYDGVVSAGIDFAGVRVEKDDEAKTVTVYLPVSTVRNITIDNESFRLFEEKQSVWNPISVKDFNQSVIELKKTAENRAVANGLLERADDNARLVVGGFVGSLVDTAAYKIAYETAE